MEDFKRDLFVMARFSNSKALALAYRKTREAVVAALGLAVRHFVSQS